jgi:hypothetical protein
MPCTPGDPKEAASYTQKWLAGKPLARLLGAERVPKFKNVEGAARP